jgi:hypothetical protein
MAVVAKLPSGAEVAVWPVVLLESQAVSNAIVAKAAAQEAAKKEYFIAMRGSKLKCMMCVRDLHTACRLLKI